MAPTQSSLRTTRIVEVLRHRLIRGRNTHEVMDLRYTVLLTHEEDGHTSGEGPVDRSYEHLLSLGTIDLRTSIDTYWIDHLIYPTHVREFLGQEDVDIHLHKPLWTKLPYEEAGILFALEQSGHLDRWRPGYIKADYDRIMDQIAFETLKEMVHHAALAPASNITLAPTRYPTPDLEIKEEIGTAPYSEVEDSGSYVDSPSFEDYEDRRW
jgi:hypothetical protein